MTLLTQTVALEANHVQASLGMGVGSRAVLHGITLAIRAGQWTSIAGPNGAGKSTLLKCLAGVLPHTGEIKLLGKPMQALPNKERARQLAWLGQNETSADDLTVHDVVMLGRLPHQAWLAPPSLLDKAAVEEALRSTGGWDWRARWVSSVAASASACSWPERLRCRRKCF